MPLEKPLKLEVRHHTVQEDNFHVNIFPVFVEKVLEEVGDRLVVDMA